MIIRVTTSNADGLNDSLTAGQLGALLGVFATTTVLSNLVSTGFRLIKVEAWAAPPAAGDTVTIGAKWYDTPLAASVGIANPPVSVSDSSGSIDKYAHYVLRPKKDSFSANFLSSAGTTGVLLFSQSSTAGNPTVTLDFHFLWYLDDIGVTPTVTLVGATAGVTYHKIMTGSTGIVYTPVPPLNSI